jgi:hypothetical protein
MKKIKIMLLSLALFAIVGGALAFKAKFNKSFCTTDAYYNPAIGYYCSFKPAGLQTVYAKCPNEIFNMTYITNVDPLLRSVCVTSLVNGTCPVTVTCSISATIMPD